MDYWGDGSTAIDEQEVVEYRDFDTQPPVVLSHEWIMPRDTLRLFFSEPVLLPQFFRSVGTIPAAGDFSSLSVVMAEDVGRSSGTFDRYSPVLVVGRSWELNATMHLDGYVVADTTLELTSPEKIRSGQWSLEFPPGYVRDLGGNDALTFVMNVSLDRTPPQLEDVGPSRLRPGDMLILDFNETIRLRRSDGGKFGRITLQDCTSLRFDGDCEVGVSASLGDEAVFLVHDRLLWQFPKEAIHFGRSYRWSLSPGAIEDLLGNVLDTEISGEVLLPAQLAHQKTFTL